VFQARRQAQHLSKDIERLRAENARLRRGANALQADRVVIERVARETLGLARADELVVFRPR
jgi:cell division protein FtsB